MSLADTGVARQASEIIIRELADDRLLSLSAQSGAMKLDIVLYYRAEGLNVRVGEVNADPERAS